MHTKLCWSLKDARQVHTKLHWSTKDVRPVRTKLCWSLKDARPVHTTLWYSLKDTRSVRTKLCWWLKDTKPVCTKLHWSLRNQCILNYTDHWNQCILNYTDHWAMWNREVFQKACFSNLLCKFTYKKTSAFSSKNWANVQVMYLAISTYTLNVTCTFHHLYFIILKLL